MNALLVLIPIALVLAALAVGIFFWAVKHDQFEDLDSPGALPLLDEPLRKAASNDTAKSTADIDESTSPHRSG